MKIFDYELFTGSKGNLLNLGDILKLTMGVVAAVVTSVLGQRILGLVESALPGNQTRIEPFVKKPQPVVSAPSAPLIKRV
jgi:hypothetical protein